MNDYSNEDENQSGQDGQVDLDPNNQYDDPNNGCGENGKDFQTS